MVKGESVCCHREATASAPTPNPRHRLPGVTVIRACIRVWGRRHHPVQFAWIASSRRPTLGRPAMLITIQTNPTGWWWGCRVPSLCAYMWQSEWRVEGRKSMHARRTWTRHQHHHPPYGCASVHILAATRVHFPVACEADSTGKAGCVYEVLCAVGVLVHHR